MSARASGGTVWSAPVLARARRALAIAVLPASILPVFAFGPGIAHAPEHLVRVVLHDLAQERS